MTAIVHGFHIDTRIVDDMMGGQHVSAGLPTFAWPHVPFNLTTLKIILPYAIVLFIIGLSESIMTLSLIDEITHTRGRASKECISQGIGNIVCGFIKGMGGCAMLGQSIININSGGRGRLSGIVAGISLLIFIVVLWPLIKEIPLAALVGVMFMSVTKFKTLFDITNDPNEVVIDFMYSRVADHSAIDAIQFITEKYIQAGKNLHLRHLSPECKRLLGKAGDRPWYGVSLNASF